MGPALPLGELVLYGLFVAAILMANLAFERWRERRRASQRPPRAPRQWTRELAESEAQALAAASPPVRPASRPAAASAAPPPDPGGPPAPRLAPGWRERTALRQAVVAMTVLGPCRALDPHDGGHRPGD